eukprot:2960799-Prymnesium_polylepis.1
MPGGLNYLPTLVGCSLSLGRFLGSWPYGFTVERKAYTYCITTVRKSVKCTLIQRINGGCAAPGYTHSERHLQPPSLHTHSPSFLLTVQAYFLKNPSDFGQPWQPNGND